MRTALRNLAFIIILMMHGTVFAQGRNNPVQVTVYEGTLASSGHAANLTLHITNEAGVSVRIVGMVIEYDTMAGDVLTFRSSDDMDVRVEPGQLVTPTITFSTGDDATGQYPNWPAPYTIESIVGASLEELRALIAAPGEETAVVSRLVNDLVGLTRAMRNAQSYHEERLSSIPDRAGWFDHEAVEALQPAAREALCATMAARVRAARRGEERVDEYRAVHGELLDHNMYTDCLGEELQLLAARSMVEIDRAQDALVMTPRDENGEVKAEWYDIYIAGRFGLAEDGAEAVTIIQFRPAIDSLAELKRLVPENREYIALRDRLLRIAANHINALVEEEKEMEALDMILLLREAFEDHPTVVTANGVAATGLVEWGIRAAAGGQPIRANNAYVRGLENFQGVPSWEEQAPRLQVARSQSFIQSAEASLEAGNLDQAEETLAEAVSRNLELDPAERSRILGGVLVQRWAEIAEMIGESRFEEAYHLAVRLEENEDYPVEALGDERANTYFELGNAIWEQYGFVGGAFGSSTLEIAEQALERGKEANPDEAAAIQSKIKISRWIMPVFLAFILLVAGTVILARGGWRKRRKARKLWDSGVRSQKGGDLSSASDDLEDAYEIIGIDDKAADIVGEESKGHMVLRIAAIRKKRGQQDQVNLWTGEWKMLDEYERPFSPEFDEALAKYTSKDSD